jgi:adenylate cyclase
MVPVMSTARRLIAVVYADMVGYSRLISLDDAGTMDRLRTLRQELIDPAVREHGGSVVQTGGDSLLVAFDSLDGAVRCAVKVQQQIPLHDGDQPPDRRIRFRIGINIGDVIPDGTNLHGDGVNIAARLEAMSPIGGICVSRSVRDHVHGRLDLRFEPIGPLTLKNLERPVEAFVLRLDPDAGAEAVTRKEISFVGEEQKTLLTPPDKPSLAVLPFQNLSGDPEQEYFSDGVVEDIITALSRTGWLFVIARNSSFTYKGKAHDIRRVGRELGVRYVLEGSIRRAGGRVRVTGQLNDAVTGGHVWADRFDSELADIFDLQDRITESVVGALEPNLQRAEIARAVAKPTENLDAYDLYLRALPLHYAHTESANCTAVALLRRALAIDPGYVRAKALLASCYRFATDWAEPGARETAVALAREVLATGSDDPDALRRAGINLSFSGGDSRAAFVALNRALLLHPNSAQVLTDLGFAHVQTVDPDPAIAYFGRAMRLSPLDPEIGLMLAGIAMAHNQAKRFEKALPYAQRAVEEIPNNAPAYRTVIYALVSLGRMEEARAAAARLLMVRPNWRAASSGWPPANRATEYRKAVIQALITVGIPE